MRRLFALFVLVAIFISLFGFYGIVHAQPVVVSDVVVCLDEIPVEFDASPVIQNGRTLVPFRTIAESIGARVTWEESTRTVLAIYQGTVMKMSIGSSYCQITRNGQSKSIDMDVVPFISHGRTYVPVRFFAEGFNAEVEWVGESHLIIITSPRKQTEIMAFYAQGTPEYSSWNDLYGAAYPNIDEKQMVKSVSTVIAGWYTMDGSGEINPANTKFGFIRPTGYEDVLTSLKEYGMRAEAMIFGADGDGTLSNLLSDKKLRDAAVSNIMKLCRDYDGVVIDFEGLGLNTETAQEESVRFNEMLTDLSVSLKNRGQTLSVVVPPLNGSYSGYDHGTIGELSDRVILMAYDYHDPKIPGPTAPLDKVQEAIIQELSHVPAGKVVLGLGAYGVEWTRTGDEYLQTGFPTHKDLKPLLDRGDAEPIWDETTATMQVKYLGGDGAEKVAWCPSPKGFKASLGLVKRYNLGGFAIWRLGLMSKELWDAIDLAVTKKPLQFYNQKRP